MDIYLACFDIEDNKARRKVGNILLEHGERVQYSVFEISVKNVTALDKIKRKCLYYIEDTDKLFFYYLPLQARKKSSDVKGNPIARYPQAVII